MHRIVLLLCLAVAVHQTKGQFHGGTSTNSHGSNFVSSNEFYIALNRLQYQQILRDYDTKLKYFREHFAGRVEAIIIQNDLSATSIMQNEALLENFRVLNNNAETCIGKYRHHIPTLEAARSSITVCAVEAINQVDCLLSVPLSRRNSLEHYYKHDFENRIARCGQKYENTTENYTSCLTSVNDDVIAFTSSNQKMFESDLKAAECTANINIKKALDCSYNAQTRITALITEVNVLIKGCLDGKDDCKPCEKYTCSKMFSFKADYKNKTILNPFYGHENNEGCLMLYVR